MRKDSFCLQSRAVVGRFRKPEEYVTVTMNDPPSPQANRLADATSPYLLQHAHNPVNWYPWSREALERAHVEDKPIFLSIGYAACHWCHVMAHESFEDKEVAALLNEHFISIKVDREERPDLDEIYMMAVQIMTGSGGWPMSVFLTPALRPFYGGTYFPPEDRYGRPGFKTILRALAHAWENRRGEVIQSSDELTALVEKHGAGPTGPRGGVDVRMLEEAVRELAASYDPEHGGFGPAPKFPSAPAISLLFRHAQRANDDAALDMAVHTLNEMGRGGIYDHLGGGFHRYSVDAAWRVPHFEKMLYDNAQLVEAYLEGFQVTRDPAYRRIVHDTLGYVLRDMQHAQGGFYSSEDADSEGEEGTYYVWTWQELEDILGVEDMRLFANAYSVRKEGNFESPEPYHAGKNILHLTQAPEALANAAGLSVEEWRRRLGQMREKVLAVRRQRTRPGLDDKVLCSWNALMISAFAKAYSVLGNAPYREAAEKAARFILNHMRQDGRLMRTWRLGAAHTDAYLEDYAFMANALADLYEATLEVTWLDAAEELLAAMMEAFWDSEAGGFFFTIDAQDDVIVRTKSSHDGAIPSGNSIAALTLLRLGKLFNKPDYIDKAQVVLELNAESISGMPRGYLKMLCALDFYLHPTKEVAIAGPRDSDAVKGFLWTLRHHFIPNKIVAFVDPAADTAGELAARVPLLMQKTLVNGAPAAYVCQDFTCQQPSTTAAAFEKALGFDHQKKELP
jgi:hypothetical protein